MLYFVELFAFGKVSEVGVLKEDMPNLIKNVISEMQWRNAVVR